MSFSDKPELSARSVLGEGNVLVGWGSARMAFGTAKLETIGLTSCIGVAIYDPVLAMGYLAHSFGSLRSYAKTIMPMVHEAAARSQEPSSMLVWARGGSVDYTPESGMGREVLEVRDETACLLGGLGIESTNLSVNWNDIPRYVIGMSLSCEEGMMRTTYSVS